MPIVYNDPLKGRPREAARIPATNRDVLEAQFAQTFEENPIAASRRFFELRSQERSGTHIDASSARGQLKNAGLENDLRVDDAGITQEALDTLIERKRMELRRADVFARAQGGVGQAVSRFGVSVATTLADPVGAGLNFVPVVGQARYAKWLGAARTLGGRAAVRAGVGALEGAAGAAIVEPLIYASRTAEQADYDAVDSLMNVAFGGIVGTAMHTTVGTLGEVLARKPAAAKPQQPSASTVAQAMKPEDFQAAVRAAVGQAVEGRSIDVDGVVRASEFVPDEERVITREINEILSAREAELTGRASGQDALTVDIGGDAGRYAEDLQSAVELRDSLAAEIAAEPAGSTRLAELRARQDQAQSLLNSRQAAMDRINQVRAAENDAQQLQYARNSARSIDDLVDALPSAQQAGFRRRIAQGRAEGYVRGPGSKLAQPDAAELSPASEQPVDNVSRETSRYAEEVLAREPERMTTEDALTAITEEEQLATKALTDLYQRLGREIKNAEYDEIIEAAKNAERWAKTAELATVCLVRGG